MTKADIVQAVYTRLGGFSKKESADLVDLVFETMKETLGRGEKIKISGFGNFVLRDKRERQGRNPQSGDPITITARRVLNFKASQLRKESLNDEESTSGGAEPAIGEDRSLHARDRNDRSWRCMSIAGRETGGPELVKLYYRIGEVSRIVGVAPQVLRYWETEFRSTRPQKSTRGQRVYSRRD